MPCEKYEEKQRKENHKEMNTKLNSMEDDIDDIRVIRSASSGIGASLFV